MREKKSRRRHNPRFYKDGRFYEKELWGHSAGTIDPDHISFANDDCDVLNNKAGSIPPFTGLYDMCPQQLSYGLGHDKIQNQYIYDQFLNLRINFLNRDIGSYCRVIVTRKEFGATVRLQDILQNTTSNIQYQSPFAIDMSGIEILHDSLDRIDNQNTSAKQYIHIEMKRFIQYTLAGGDPIANQVRVFFIVNPDTTPTTTYATRVTFNWEHVWTQQKVDIPFRPFNATHFVRASKPNPNPGEGYNIFKNVMSKVTSFQSTVLKRMYYTLAALPSFALTGAAFFYVRQQYPNYREDVANQLSGIIAGAVDMGRNGGAAFGAALDAVNPFLFVPGAQGSNQFRTHNVFDDSVITDPPYKDTEDIDSFRNRMYTKFDPYGGQKLVDDAAKLRKRLDADLDELEGNPKVTNGRDEL